MNAPRLIGGVAVIEKDGKHFLIKQSSDKPHGGQWRHVGGKFKLHEDPINGLKREIREEVGLEVEVIDEKPFMIMKSDYEPGNFGFFKAEVKGGELRMDEKEVEDVGWFSVEEIKELNLMNATRKFYESIYIKTFEVHSMNFNFGTIF